MKTYLLYFLLLSFPFAATAQKQQVYNLPQLMEQGKITVFNRDCTIIQENSTKFLRLPDKEGEGLVWLPIKEFKNGTIRVEMRGKDVYQRSFVGIAFYGLNDSTYDAIYCRPFNFQTTDSVRRIHAIQYISQPAYPWRRLRAEQNGVFENEILNAPKPTDWFTMRIVIANDSIKAFINQADKPSLVVKKLHNREKGRVGIFVADRSDGDFKSVVVKYEK